MAALRPSKQRPHSASSRAYHDGPERVQRLRQLGRRDGGQGARHWEPRVHLVPRQRRLQRAMPYLVSCAGAARLGRCASQLLVEPTGLAFGSATSPRTSRMACCMRSTTSRPKQAAEAYGYADLSPCTRRGTARAPRPRSAGPCSAPCRRTRAPARAARPPRGPPNELVPMVATARSNGPRGAIWTRPTSRGGGSVSRVVVIQNQEMSCQAGGATFRLVVQHVAATPAAKRRVLARVHAFAAPSKPLGACEAGQPPLCAAAHAIRLLEQRCDQGLGRRQHGQEHGPVNNLAGLRESLHPAIRRQLVGELCKVAPRGERRLGGPIGGARASLVRLHHLCRAHGELKQRGRLLDSEHEADLARSVRVGRAPHLRDVVVELAVEQQLVCVGQEARHELAAAWVLAEAALAHQLERREERTRLRHHDVEVPQPSARARAVLERPVQELAKELRASRELARMHEDGRRQALDVEPQVTRLDLGLDARRGFRAPGAAPPAAPA